MDDIMKIVKSINESGFLIISKQLKIKPKN